MQVHNIRLGLATNSSSSHSIVMLDAPAHDDEADGEFGWNFFTAASAESKRAYLALALWECLSETLPEHYRETVMREFYGLERIKDGYVDHQSRWALPCSFGTDLPDQSFVFALRKYLEQPGVAILGGNDNTDENHPLRGAGKDAGLHIPKDDEAARWTCRHDPVADMWAIFNRTNGAKIRLSFGRKAEYRKSHAPELVDIKLTDYCPMGCAFCYQGSTEQGTKRARLSAYDLARVLGEMQVFEVALGGGEPTLLEDFVDTLAVFRGRGIVPNFTTKSLHWLHNQVLGTRVFQHAGAFAFSVDSAKDIDRLVDALVPYKKLDVRASVQVVMGTMGRHEFGAILRKASENYLPVTLLGYKTTGRGHAYKPQDYSWWLAEVKNLKLGRVGIDTAIAAQFEREIIAASIPARLFTTQEGKFSCYIDAVAGTIGPSSYCNASEMRDMADGYLDASALQRQYASF